ncbi:MAG: homoserine dehydrogenase [Victivallaceae bacterium]
MKEVKVGIIGFGTVGAGVAANLLKNGDVIAKRTGVQLVLTKIADLDITTDRGVTVPSGVLTTDAMALIKEVDVVIELVGGTTFAKKFILEALKQGKPIVTANKALLAEHGEELFAAAEQSKADIYYEASVAGGIPVIKALREGLVANRIESIYGIMNGTCNYILTRMEREKLDFWPILKDAQALGYAETEPSLDIDGFDTAHKAAILASLAYGEWFGLKPVHIEGIRDISLTDLQFADELGYRIKLLAIIKQENEDVQVRVHPTLIPKNSMLGNISEVFNGVMIEGDTVGKTLFYGRGAGRNATASAVVADLVDVGLNLKFGSHRRVPAFRLGRQYRHLLTMNEVETRYYLRLQVKDQPGVIAKIADILGSKAISISSFVQRESQTKENVPLLILTHKAKEELIKKAIDEFEQLDVVCEKVKLFRIEDV